MTFTKGDILYWTRVPEGRFEFVKMNPDGTVQMWGGAAGREMYRDAYLKDVTTKPFGGVDKIRVWAAANLFAEVTVKELAERLDLPDATVRRFVMENPDLFRKTEGWRYEVRDPVADRAAANATPRKRLAA